MKLSKNIKIILRTLTGVVFFFLLLFIIWIFEHNQEDASIKTFFDVIWFSVVTLTTVGYGDYYPITFVGRITGLILVLFSFGLLGYVIGNLTNKIREYMEKKKYGQFGTNMENHIVIIGWNNFGKLIADQIINANQSIAVITDFKDNIDLIHTNYGDKVFTLFSDLNAFEDFKKVNIEKTCSVFLNLPNDSKALVYLLNIKKVYPSINTVVSLSNSELKDTFYSAGANYVISEKELSSRLIASYIFEPDVAHYTEDLITTSSDQDATDILELMVTENNPYVNQDYIDVFIDMKKTYNTVLIGISRKENGVYRLIKNASAGETIQLNDYLIVISDGIAKSTLTKKFSIKEGRIH